MGGEEIKWDFGEKRRKERARDEWASDAWRKGWRRQGGRARERGMDEVRCR